jgi:hypothetical protein
MGGNVVGFRLLGLVDCWATGRDIGRDIGIMIFSQYRRMSVAPRF